MKEKSLFIAAAVASVVSMAAPNTASAEYDANSRHCYGAALAGKNHCAPKAMSHSCKGQSTEHCSTNDWKMAKSENECTQLIAACKQAKASKS